MRLIFGIICLLFGMGMLSCQMEGPAQTEAHKPTSRRAATSSAPNIAWVRTVDGWERADSWNVGEVVPPRLHPLVVAAGQGLLSLLGLVACQRDGDASGCRCGF